MKYQRYTYQKRLPSLVSSLPDDWR